MRFSLDQTCSWLLPFLCGIALVTGTLLSIQPAKDDRLQGFESIPVVANGRVQPLDSLARNALLICQGRQSIKDPDHSLPTPSAWLAELAFRPDLADRRPIFRVNNDEVMGQLGLTRDETKSVSFEQLREFISTIEKESFRIGQEDAKLWSAYETSLMQLARGMKLYNRLKHALSNPGADELESEFILFRSSIDGALAESEKRQSGDPFNEAIITNSTSRMRSLIEWATKTHVYTTPPGSDAHQDEWRRLPDSVLDSIDADSLHPSTLAFARMNDAYKKGGDQGNKEFRTSVSSYREWLETHHSKDSSKARAEVLFNQMALFRSSIILYVTAFLVASLSWISVNPSFRKAAFRILVIGFCIHSAGLLFRMLLEGRPPVTNLYSSAVFIGWGAIALSLALEAFYRNGIGTVTASVIGFATLLIAHHLSLAGDTLEMMRAVLDSNFWLATHVIVITLGYSATFLAGAIAIYYLLRRLFGDVPRQAATSMRGMVYGIICFATFASFVGTVLGGIWADQSWGRFWGWDPKENGALLIVIWNAIILHARWGGMVRERGMMVMAVFGNIVTSWSWFGTNMLGIGLHSYGFTDAAFPWLSLFVISQLLIMSLALVRRKKAGVQDRVVES